MTSNAQFVASVLELMQALMPPRLVLILVLHSMHNSSGLLKARNRVDAIPYNPFPYTIGTVSVGLMMSQSHYQLPFPICFCRSNYTQLIVGSNGIVSFDVSCRCILNWQFSDPYRVITVSSQFGSVS